MQAYSDPSRESDPYALPNIETFCEFKYECDECGKVAPGYRDYYGVVDTDCHDCGAKHSRVPEFNAGAHGGFWWYWYCLPGCLPDSDPCGPFDTEAAALADARENACE